MPLIPIHIIQSNLHRVIKLPFRITHRYQASLVGNISYIHLFPNYDISLVSIPIVTMYLRLCSSILFWVSYITISLLVAGWVEMIR